MTVSWYGVSGARSDAPVEERVDHHAGHGVAERVDHRGSPGVGPIGVGAVRVDGLEVVGEQRLAEGEIAVERLAVRVEQQLARVTPVAGRRIEGAVDAKSVALARGDVRQIGVPDVSVDLVEGDPRLAAVVVDQAQLDLLGDLGEQREVGARAVIGGAERIRGPRPNGGQSGLGPAGIMCGSARHSARSRGWIVRRHHLTLSAPGVRAARHHQPVLAPIWRPSSLVMVRT